MYNYHLITKNSKMDLLEKTLNFAIESTDWEVAGEYLYNIRWLFEEMNPEAEKYFFPKEKGEEDVQLPENKEC